MFDVALLSCTFTSVSMSARLLYVVRFEMPTWRERENAREVSAKEWTVF